MHGGVAPHHSTWPKAALCVALALHCTVYFFSRARYGWLRLSLPSWCNWSNGLAGWSFNLSDTDAFQLGTAVPVLRRATPASTGQVFGTATGNLARGGVNQEAIFKSTHDTTSFKGASALH